MKIVGLEEHYVTADVIDAWRKLEPRWQDPSVSTSAESDIERRLLSLGEERLSVMDDAGVDTQVLSLTTPGLWIGGLIDDCLDHVGMGMAGGVDGDTGRAVQEDVAVHILDHAP